MPSFPLKGIFTILFAGGAVTGISIFPQILGQGERVPRLILGKGNNGQDLYIRFEDLQKQELISQDDEEEDGDKKFTSVNLWLGGVQLDFRGGKHSLKSPNQDGKYYLLETKGNNKFLGGRKIPSGDTRSDTLKQYANNNPNYIQLEKSQWAGFSNYTSSNTQLEEIQSCVYSIPEEEGYDSHIFVVCSPHQDTGLWHYRGAQYLARDFDRKEIVR